MRKLRDGMSPQERAEKSEAICSSAAEQVSEGSTVLVYASFRSEVDTTQLIRLLWQKQCRVCLPRVIDSSRMEAVLYTEGDTLAKDRFGICFPESGIIVPSDALDTVFVPGLAFDLRGGRLGYGAGYYDRYLEKCRAECIGLAFSGQIVSEVPREKTDAFIHKLIDENRMCFFHEAT